MRIARTLTTVAVLLAVLGPSDLIAADRCSGAVVSIDPAAGTLLVAEVGPWQVKDGATVTTPRRFDLTAATVYERVARAKQAPSGYAGDFVQTPIAPADIAVGDHVTIQCEERGARLIAAKVSVMTPEP
jgi:hypothetical protein